MLGLPLLSLSSLRSCPVPFLFLRCSGCNFVHMKGHSVLTCSHIPMGMPTHMPITGVQNELFCAYKDNSFRTDSSSITSKVYPLLFMLTDFPCFFLFEFCCLIAFIISVSRSQVLAFFLLSPLLPSKTCKPHLAAFRTPGGPTCRDRRTAEGPDRWLTDIPPWRLTPDRLA